MRVGTQRVSSIIFTVACASGITACSGGAGSPTALTPTQHGPGILVDQKKLNNVWSTLAPMPTARFAFGTAATKKDLYTVGGYGTAGILNTMDAYNPVGKTWSAKAPMPTARYLLGAATIDDVLYAVGGVDPNQATNHSGSSTYSTVESYNPKTNAWTTNAPMPTSRFLPGVAADKGILYVIGGLHCDSFTSPCSYVPTLEAYDPSTDRWTTKTPMPAIQANFAGVGFANGILYVVSGDLYVPNGSGQTGALTDLVQAYDPATDTWTMRKPIPISSDAGSVTSLLGKLYVIGGGNINTLLNAVQIYDPIADSWTSGASMPTARYYLGAAPIDSTVYAVGGYNNGFLNTVEGYQLGT